MSRAPHHRTKFFGFAALYGLGRFGRRRQPGGVELRPHCECAADDSRGRRLCRSRRKADPQDISRGFIRELFELAQDHVFDEALTQVADAGSGGRLVLGPRLNRYKVRFCSNPVGALKRRSELWGASSHIQSRDPIAGSFFDELRTWGRHQYVCSLPSRIAVAPMSVVGAFPP